MIIIRNIEKKYNHKVVLNIPELSINEGELLGLVGNNGAGKTTLFRLMLDLIKADKGGIISYNKQIEKSEIWKDYTGSYLDEAFLIDFLTPEEFFYFIGELYGYSKAVIDEKLFKYESFFNDEILRQKKKYIRDFSKGNKQKIGVVSTLLSEPKVLILDEPFNSLDPTSQILLKKILIDYHKQTGATIIISSHDLNHIMEICQRLVILEKGLLIRDIQTKTTTLSELKEYFKRE